MLRILFIIISALGISATSLVAQPSRQQADDVWGRPVEGVKMSIAISNSVMAIGTNFSITVKIVNLSTNVVLIGESLPENDFKVSLMTQSGQKTYQLTRNAFAYSRFIVTNLIPGGIRDWTIRLSLNKYYEPPGFIATEKNIPAGNYTLKAIRKCGTKNGSLNLESNSLKIQIK